MAEVALRMPNMQKPDREATISMVDYSPEIELMQATWNLMSEHIRATIASAGGKPPRIAPMRGPKTALQQLRHERRVAKHRMVVSRVLDRTK